MQNKEQKEQNIQHTICMWLHISKTYQPTTTCPWT